MFVFLAGAAQYDCYLQVILFLYTESRNYMSTVVKALVVANILVPFTLMTSVSAKPLPLQPGIYYGGGSRYITIFKKSNRYCYSGVSNNGESYFSLESVPKYPGVYKLGSKGKNTVDDSFITQTGKDTIAFGSLEQVQNYPNDYMYRFDGAVSKDAIRQNPNIQRCLNSNKPFNLIIPSNR